jgi:hypothetical protein
MPSVLAYKRKEIQKLFILRFIIKKIQQQYKRALLYRLWRMKRATQKFYRNSGDVRRIVQNFWEREREM